MSTIPARIPDTMQGGGALRLYEEWQKSVAQVELLKQDAIVPPCISLRDSDAGRTTPRVITSACTGRITFWGKFARAVLPLRISRNWDGQRYKSRRILNRRILSPLFHSFLTEVCWTPLSFVMLIRADIIRQNYNKNGNKGYKSWNIKLNYHREMREG